MLLLFAIQALAIEEFYNEQQCKDLGINNCQRCQSPANTVYGPIQNFCLECTYGNRWEEISGVLQCVPLPKDKYTIKGWGRDCAECGAGNFWNGNTCKPCRYESAKCEKFNCCSDSADILCNVDAGFTLEDSKCICKRGLDFKVNGICHCPDDLTYLEYDEASKEYSCTDCVDKCPIGCSNFVCPKGTYLDSSNSDRAEQCKCKPIHYSCADATNDLPVNCLECNTVKGFSQLYIDLSGDSYCYCDCCKLENKLSSGAITCENLVNPADVYSQCVAPVQCGVNFIWSDKTQKCECSVKNLLIGDECLPLNVKYCYKKFSLHSEMVGNGQTYVCQCISGYVFSSATRSCKTQ